MICPVVTLRIMLLTFGRFFFLKVRTVSKILIQGRGNWYDWVTGFYLFLSNDGQWWTGYSESGDKQHSNVREIFETVILNVTIHR